MNGISLNKDNYQQPVDSNKYWASAALLQLCKLQSQNPNVSQLTQLLTSPTEVALNRGPILEATQMTTGKWYRSKKRTLRSLQRRFSEDMLNRLAHKHGFKRSLSMDGNGLCKNLRQNLAIDSKEIKRNEALSKHLGKLTRFVEKIEPKLEADHKSPFFNVLANYNPFQNGCETVSHQTKTFLEPDFMNISYNTAGASFAENHNCQFPFDDNRIPSPFPFDYFSNPCSPAVYSLETPLSASAPSIRDLIDVRSLIDDLRKSSTDEELKSSFEDIHVGDEFLVENDDNVFTDLLTP